MDLFKKEQIRLARKVVLHDTDKISHVGGAYCVVCDDTAYACVIIFSFPELKIIEQKTSILETKIPYHKEYQAYREMPAIVDAFNQLEVEPDLLMVFGVGINHPRRLGIASHLGLLLNVATLGVSDTLHFGEVKDDKISLNNEVVGFVFKTKEYANPIYVSPGYKISLANTKKIISSCIIPPHKLPEPVHIVRKNTKMMMKHAKTQ